MSDKPPTLDYRTPPTAEGRIGKIVVLVLIGLVALFIVAMVIAAFGTF